MRLWYGLIVLLGCSACSALTEVPAAPHLETPTDFLDRRLDSAGLIALIDSAYPGRRANRWDTDALTLAALYYNGEMGIARTKLELARAGQITAGQRPNPTISLSPGYDASKMRPWFLGLGVNWPIETGRKRALRIEQAQDLGDAAKYRIASAAWAVRARVVRALIDLHVARGALDIYRAQASNLKRIIDLYARRTAQGQLQSEAATQATINYQRALLNQGGAVKRSAEARAQLAVAIGFSVAALENIRVDTTALAGRPARPATLRAALARHNDLLAALADYAAAHKALRLELAKRMPDIDIGPGYEWSNDGGKFTLGLSVTLPVLNNNEGPIAEATAKRRLAAERFNALQAGVIGRAQSAQAGLKAAIQIRATADALVATQREALDRMRTRLHAGEASTLPLLTAQVELDSAGAARQDADLEVLNARAALEDALQQRLFGHVFDANLAIVE